MSNEKGHHRMNDKEIKEQLEFLRNPNLFIPKIYSFEQVRELISYAEEQARKAYGGCEKCKLCSEHRSNYDKLLAG